MFDQKWKLKTEHKVNDLERERQTERAERHFSQMLYSDRHWIGTVVILVCELDIHSSVIRWWIRSELLVSILMTPVSRLHSHRYRLNWLAPFMTMMMTMSSHSLINLSGQLHTNDHTTHEHCISQPIAEAISSLLMPYHSLWSIVYHRYISRSAIDEKKTYPS